MRYHHFVLIAALALALAVTASANRAQADLVAPDDHPATVPADIQLEPILSDQFATPPTPSSPSYFPPPVLSQASPPQSFTPVAPSYQEPAQQGTYPNISTSWTENSAEAQPAPPMPCEATGCNNDAPWTHWYFEADLVGFTRGSTSRNQADFGIVPGPYLALGTFVDPHNQWQLVYFIAPGMSADARSFGANGNYDSTFQSAELNYLHSWDHWSFLAGFRYLQLDDRLTVQDFFRQDMRTTNNLYGGQLGIGYHYEGSWLLVEWAWKFGIYANSAEEHNKVSIGGGTATSLSHITNVSGSYENDLFLGHRFSPHWMGRIGLVDLLLTPDKSFSTDGTISIVGFTIGGLGQW